MEFYNVKKRARVVIEDSKCTPVVLSQWTLQGTRQTYAAKAVDDDGTAVIKFITKQQYDSLK